MLGSGVRAKPSPRHDLEGLAQKRVVNALEGNAVVDAHFDEIALGPGGLAVIEHRLGRHHVVGHHQAAAIFEREEGGAPGDAADAAVERRGHLVGKDGEPVAQHIGAVEIDRQPAEQILNRRLQRDAQNDGGGARSRHKPGDRQALLEIEPERQAENEEGDGDQSSTSAGVSRPRRRRRYRSRRKRGSAGRSKRRWR